MEEVANRRDTVVHVTNSDEAHEDKNIKGVASELWRLKVSCSSHQRNRFKNTHLWLSLLSLEQKRGRHGHPFEVVSVPCVHMEPQWPCYLC